MTLQNDLYCHQFASQPYSLTASNKTKQFYATGCKNVYTKKWALMSKYHNKPSNFFINHSKCKRRCTGLLYITYLRLIILYVN